ncbi:unnamed protein product [Tilletia laevis]|uniref:Protein kinase domain-containing protein n=2 Tax=Tilletia TaxID=13289 RepID=A0A8T8TJ92_9BASI|nr:hypothetical protein CF336_g3226 [Tilletia laevis]KAE8261004.1 hypothetical protein A4X03_0g3627 [Tilletia caries]CAD6886131.1 unnamed protein product [Tilletia caries]CAD6918291.1 unnamed protein product [Tilletia caries]CAD6933061.1 unnamed protein product [Tilletia laevis]
MLHQLTENNFNSRPRADTTASARNQLKVVDYSLSWKLRSLRLSLVYQGMVIHLRVPRKGVSDGAPVPFETTLFDTVEQTWGEGTRDANTYWLRRTFHHNEQPARVDELEEELVRKIAELLPPALESHIRPGAQLFAKLETDSDEGKMHVSLVNDLFVDKLAAHLPVLSPEECKGVPRINLTAIDSYVTCWDDHVWLVNIILPPSTTPIRAVLKMARIPANGELTELDVERLQTTSREPHVLFSLPPHPNVMPAPLALMTLKSQDTKSETSSPCEKLVGMVLPYFSGDPLHRLGERSDENLKRRLRYCYEFASAVEHVNHQGIFHGDIGLDKVVLSAPPPNDRAVLIGFNLGSVRIITWGDVILERSAPEITGHWDVSMHDGKLVYNHCKEPKRRSLSIRTEWANMPKALERFEVFNVGHTLSEMVQCPVYFPWLEAFLLEHIHSTGPDAHRPGDHKDWESRIPKVFAELVQRCCSYDPRERPLLGEIVAELKSWA